MNDIVQGVEELLEELLLQSTTLTLDLAMEDVIVNVDANQMNQVLMNLSENARDAMPHHEVPWL
jgi:two-component system, cell cycle sensor histidine kinase and response regulator CckA